MINKKKVNEETQWILKPFHDEDLAARQDQMGKKTVSFHYYISKEWFFSGGRQVAEQKRYDTWMIWVEEGDGKDQIPERAN